VIKYLRCPECGLYQYGPPVDNSFYGDEDYHANYERHHERKVRTATIRLHRIASLLAAERPRILDVGCGTGAILEAAQHRGWEASGVDVSDRMVQRGREQGLDVHPVSGHELPFADESFDVVTAWSVIEHVSDVRVTLAEWRSVLRVGGVLVVDTSDALCWKVQLLGAKYRRFWRPDHTYAFTPATLGEFLTQAGFELLPRPFLGSLRGLSPAMAGYALAYQSLFEVRQALGLQKPFQLFARRTAAEAGGTSRAAA
jgi:ubiquinone/menaquinone biosynthesis C-methylase UbiE